MSEQKMVTIRIPMTRNEQNDVYVGYNGKKYLIKRNEDVKVPVGVAKIIKRSEKALATAIAYETKAAQKLSDM